MPTMARSSAASSNPSLSSASTIRAAPSSSCSHTASFERVGLKTPFYAHLDIVPIPQRLLRAAEADQGELGLAEIVRVGHRALPGLVDGRGNAEIDVAGPPVH